MAASAAESSSTSPVAVVGSRFCLSYAVRLTVAKEVLSLSDGDFTVKDVNGDVVFKVMGEYLSPRGHCVLVNAAGTPRLTMLAKMFSSHQRWEVFRGESTKVEDLVFSVKKSNPLQLTPEMDVILADNPNEEACDFKIKGSFLEGSCTIYQGNSGPVIAQMNREYTTSRMLFGKVKYDVRVYPNVDYAFISALIVLFDRTNV